LEPIDLKYKTIYEKMVFPISGNPEKVLDRIWCIGGDSGWYYGTRLWKIRGILDKITGGIGFRKGRRDPKELKEGDAIDFWRVINVDKEKRVLQLKAEMNIPGEVYLKWEIHQNQLLQTINFVPKSWKGEVYWYIVRPFHFWIFYNMGKRITSQRYMKSPH
jgi:hypothetical protein